MELFISLWERRFSKIRDLFAGEIASYKLELISQSLQSILFANCFTPLRISRILQQ